FSQRGLAVTAAALVSTRMWSGVDNRCPGQQLFQFRSRGAARGRLETLVPEPSAGRDETYERERRQDRK
ncbi:hypothetical protein, partial [Rhodococcus sp. AJR001]|uniref:hypothetical protein n=1 Tax=Rhodococcus sp. AJR001 TaxID=1852041 RepID=UPI003FA78389